MARPSLAVTGILALTAAERPAEQVHVQGALEGRAMLADHIDAHLAVDKLRRRHGWAVDAEEGRLGYRLGAWPFSFPRCLRRRTLP